jgi:predicted secreted hydrolase
MLKRLIAFGLILSLLAAAFWWVTRPKVEPAPPTLLSSDDTDIAGFARVFEPRAFQFPRDHGPHFDYQTEWWYYTGNLDTEDSRHIGYQLTFFRRGLTPGLQPRTSDFATNQIYFAHFAVTDVAGNQHTFAERFSRGAAGLAGASGEPFHVWLEDWRVESLTADGSAVRLMARNGDQAIDLTLRAVKPIVAHGNQGLSQKSETPGNASYYLSYTRLATEGRVTLNGKPATVKGESWFDHEWSTSALGAGIIGWNWFSLQLSDGRELMFYQFRQADGGIGALSSGTLVQPDGSTVQLKSDEAQIEALSTWQSSESKGVYPARWRVVVPSVQIDLTLEPWIAEQEMRVSFPYWEGAVRLNGTSSGVAVTGNGYAELTGYVSSMQGVF